MKKITKIQENVVVPCDFTKDSEINNFSPALISTGDIMRTNGYFQGFWLPPKAKRNPFVVAPLPILAKDKPKETIIMRDGVKYASRPPCTYANGYKLVALASAIKPDVHSEGLLHLDMYQAVQNEKQPENSPVSTPKGNSGKGKEGIFQPAIRGWIAEGLSKEQLQKNTTSLYRVERPEWTEKHCASMARAQIQRVHDLESGKYVPSEHKGSNVSTIKPALVSNLSESAILALANNPLASAKEIGVSEADYAVLVRVISVLADSGLLEIEF